MNHRTLRRSAPHFYPDRCPVLNEEARKKLEHMGMEVPEEHECDKKVECSPNSGIGRIYRAKRKMLTQIDWDNPQFS